MVLAWAMTLALAACLFGRAERAPRHAEAHGPFVDTNASWKELPNDAAVRAEAGGPI